MGEYFQLLGWSAFCVFVFFLTYERTLDHIAHRKQRREWEQVQGRRIHQHVAEDRAKRQACGEGGDDA